MAKKKKKPTPKDDLIDSLLNDVQEFSDQEAKQERNASADLFLDDYESGNGDKELIVGLDGDEHRLEPTNVGAANLWQQLNVDVPDAGKIQADDSKVIIPAYGDSESDEAFESYRPTAPPVENYPEGFKVPPIAYDDKTININEFVKKQVESDKAPIAPPRLEELAIGDEDEEEADNERTVAVEGFANRQPRPLSSESAPKVSFGALRGSQAGSGSIYASADATLAQAESLKMAQQRILELEREVEKYRQENDELASAGEIIRGRAEELNSRILSLEGDKKEIIDSLRNELMIVKGSLQYKEEELGKARLKTEELEARLKSDFKKIRVRERELENRLELVKAEKSALLRAKDENILELKRKIDHLESELDNYRRKVLELNKTIDTNQEQFKRTVRALRLALSNLEVKEENVVPLKKAD